MKERNPRQVLFWDDAQKEVIAQIICSNPIKNILLDDTLLIATHNKVYIHRFEDLEIMNQISTYDNPKGLIVENNDTLVFLGSQKGEIMIKNNNRDYLKHQFGGNEVLNFSP